jgi:AraC family transcriptional regulator of adaptative response/methylated-DNA-[protein]-cysteine methyltransferase
MAPSVRRDGGRGETIRHATAETSLGRILVAHRARRLRHPVRRKPEDLAAWLRRRFPNADLAGEDPRLPPPSSPKAVDLVERPGQGRDLPLDLRGTAFQERVWQALRAIPPGATASYADVAAAIGQPGAARGVATACAANAVAVAVPCHRVVRADGALSGYRWGVARKAALLARERGD